VPSGDGVRKKGRGREVARLGQRKLGLKIQLPLLGFEDLGNRKQMGKETGKIKGRT
jgi:hypothetical protein